MRTINQLLDEKHQELRQALPKFDPSKHQEIHQRQCRGNSTQSPQVHSAPCENCQQSLGHSPVAGAFQPAEPASGASLSGLAQDF